MSIDYKLEQAIENIGTEDEMVFMEVSMVKRRISRRTKRMVIRIAFAITFVLFGSAIILFGEPAWSTLAGFVVIVLGICPLTKYFIVDEIPQEEE